VNEYPVRIELSGNRVETIRQFDPDTQTSVIAVACAEIYPVELEEGAARHALFDYMGKAPAIYYEDRDAIVQCAGLFTQRAHDTWSLMNEDEPGVPPPSDFYISSGEFSGLLGKLEAAGNIAGSEDGNAIKPVNNPVRTGIKSESAGLPHERLEELLEGNDSCPLFVVALQTEADINRFSAIMTQQGTVHTVRRFGFLAGGLSGITLTAGIIPETFIDRETGAMFVSSFDLFGHKSHRKETRKAKAQHFVEVFKELDPGDLVVHRDYGIGKYRGLAELKVTSGGGSANAAGRTRAPRQDAFMQDFLLIEYRDGDKLYCPVYRLELVQKYIGSGETVLDKLGSKGWERKKASAGEAAREMAGKLIKLYAEREMSAKDPFSAPDALYREFETSFPYELTDDQERAVEEVLGDMALPKCMDRLVCGDVGFGKTEVAVRAAFKAVEDGRQVAVLVPTTILAEQHFLTFSERFKETPVVIESLSRLRTKAEQKEIVRGLADGRIDIVIGTHRLLSGDIAFKKIGLIITDEEHRFGVAQKERFKELKRDVDSISLTATPIPRTLNMSLSGIRDMSIISTPPRNRTAIKTSIIKFNRALIREGILRELNRGGQVFFLHNRVASIGKMRKILEEIVPEARIETAHGQMKPHDIEKVMLSFLNGDANLLLCSAIIESGIDIPRANTIFINRADLFGISQLYQIRGRVGRSSEKAQAYLIVPERLNAEAVKRLNTVRKFGELGSGFILSMHDLEIRGAGNLLGEEQSGHILSIGFEMYSELLNDEVRRIRGEKVE
ncbi:MAG: DEAD/DEAH box helicase, partial [Deltaproteobacteria bacterium]|nr:DEAD/DEAH box helicase [Deltaproteobacteria bacterium]